MLTKCDRCNQFINCVLIAFPESTQDECLCETCEDIRFKELEEVINQHPEWAPW